MSFHSRINVPSFTSLSSWIVGLPETATLADDLINAVVEPKLPERYKKIHSGKVRETYVNPDNPNELLIVATDRISTHDVVHKSAIPGKWTCLTKVSNFWFDVLSKDERTKDIPSQMVSPQKFPADFPEDLKERTIVVKRLKALPIEAIVRWYLYGSALEDKNTWKKYDESTWCLPTWEFVWKGLQKCSKFKDPLFTPSKKVEWWHDENINFDEMVKHLTDFFGWDTEKALNIANQIRDYSLKIYNVVNEYAKEKWVTLWDTKFEFWIDENGKLYIIDEICTPDSSRYWTTETIVEWKEPTSHDKQAVRDDVVEKSKKLWKKAWDIPLYLPQEVIRKTMKTYWDMTNRFVNKKWQKLVSQAEKNSNGKKIKKTWWDIPHYLPKKVIKTMWIYWER